jgi:hypothetical protein
VLVIVGPVYHFQADAEQKQDEQTGSAAEKDQKYAMVELITGST